MIDPFGVDFFQPAFWFVKLLGHIIASALNFFDVLKAIIHCDFSEECSGVVDMVNILQFAPFLERALDQIFRFRRAVAEHPAHHSTKIAPVTTV